jgi:Na+-transporting methylmalonyl-CoA/oxaloacetate decarboxylase gamma subunit
MASARGHRNRETRVLKGLEILVTGIVVVMAVLILLWVSCAVMGVVFRAVEARRTTARAKAEAAPAPAAPPVAAGIPPHHLAAIAAATATVLDGPHRIVRVSAPPLGSTDWANQARLQTFNKSLGQGNWGRTVTALTRANT